MKTQIVPGDRMFKSFNVSEGITKENLHKDFVKLGNDRRKLTNELLALLPEIYEKKIFRKYAATIVEYAGKFGGLSKGVVLKRLRLEKHLEGKPLLKESIKAEGVHKVALVANLATAETEAIWVDKLKNMSKAAIQELSKEVRSKNNLFNLENNLNMSCKAVPLKLKLKLDEKLTGTFLKLKKKFGENLSNNEILQKIFEAALEEKPKRTVSTAKVKESKESRNVDSVNNENNSSQSQEIIPGDNFKFVKPKTGSAQTPKTTNPNKPVTRYIPAKIKKHLLTKSNHQCSYPNCNKTAEIFHHTSCFAAHKNHNSLVTLCKVHHEFVHNGLIRNETSRSDNWYIDINNYKISNTDNFYRVYRKTAISKQAVHTNHAYLN